MRLSQTCWTVNIFSSRYPIVDFPKVLKFKRFCSVVDLKKKKKFFTDGSGY